MQRFPFPLLLMMSVLVSEEEVLQNQLALRLFLLFYAANDSRRFWIARAVYNKYQLSDHWLYSLL